MTRTLRSTPPHAPARIGPVVALASVLLLAGAPQLEASSPPGYVFAMGAPAPGGAESVELVRFQTNAMPGYLIGGCYYPLAGVSEFGILWQEFQVLDTLTGPALVPFGSTLVLSDGTLSTGSVVEVTGAHDAGVEVSMRQDGGRVTMACIQSAAFSRTGPHPWDIVSLVAAFNMSSPDGMVYTIPPAGVPVAFPWNHTGGDAGFARWDDLLARAKIADATLTGRDLTVLAGGALHVRADAGMYGTFSVRSNATWQQGQVVVGPDIVLVPASSQAGGHAPDQFAGRPGEYVLANLASQGSWELLGLVAAWVDAPMPPGVAPRAI